MSDTTMTEKKIQRDPPARRPSARIPFHISLQRGQRADFTFHICSHFVKIFLIRTLIFKLKQINLITFDFTSHVSESLVNFPQTCNGKRINSVIYRK